MYLWRAVDSEGELLDLLVQTKPDTKAGLRLMRELLKKHGYAPDVLVTDKLGSYGAAGVSWACRHAMSRSCARTTEPRTPISRYDERKMQRFKSVGSAQRFPSMHAPVHNTFALQRHLISRSTLRTFRTEAAQAWQTATAAA